jgi:hypothetical protein
MQESSSALCYFLTFEDGQIRVQDSDLKPLTEKALHGLYSFIHYNKPRLMVVGELHEHRSQHSGLSSIVEALKRQWQALRHHLFFNRLASFVFPNEKPSAGGGLFVLNGVVVLWHLKSGSYSLPNDHCHDQNPALDELIKQIGLPSDRFVSLEQAEQFERDYLQQHFHPNGQLINEHSSYELAHQLSEILKLQDKSRRQELTHEFKKTEV